MIRILVRLRARGWRYLGVFAYAWLVYRTAWVSDDAFISLRTASNWIHGYGLTWNVDERVQTFTHPLWLMLLTCAHLLTGEPFYSTLVLSCAVSCAAVACLVSAPCARLPETLIGLVILCFSQAFIDFSSSGLENPLTYLFVAAFVRAYLVLPASALRFRWLAAITGLAALNRLDTLLLFSPALAACAWREGMLLRARQGAFALIPLLCWEVFSLAYYGFPFPNTAYAKLTESGAGLLVRWSQGVGYLVSSLETDALTPLAIASCLVLALYRRDRARTWLLSGAACYLLYVVHVGGDFMKGRFLAAPLLLCVGCFSSSSWLQSTPQRSLYLALTLLLAFTGRWPPPFTGADYALAPGESQVDAHGIHNERRMFFASDSLRNARRDNPARESQMWTHGGVLARRRLDTDPDARVQLIDAIGHAGYYAGPRVHIVDRWALADALLARLPPVSGQYGHYPRVIPEGYLETLRSGVNRIRDVSLAKYYDALSLVIRGPLFSAERARAIWELNRGAYDQQLDTYAYIRGWGVVAHVRFQNPTAYRCMVAYVWNAGRTSSYLIDASSSTGKRYDARWEISADGATLSAPVATQLRTFQALRPHGMFTLSLAFLDAPDKPIRQLYELRYSYRVANGELTVQRQPLSSWNPDFPTAPWIDGPVDAALALTRPLEPQR
jgi:arabinofuranosyltransferase